MKKLRNRYTICFDSGYQRIHVYLFSKYRELSELLLPVFGNSASYINRR